MTSAERCERMTAKGRPCQGKALPGRTVCVAHARGSLGNVAAPGQEAELVGLVWEAAREGQWRAAVWLLERLFPVRQPKLGVWAQEAATRDAPLSIPPAAPVDPFAELDDLAEARRRRA